MRIVRPCTVVLALLMMATTTGAFETDSQTDRLEFPLAWDAASLARTFLPAGEAPLGRSAGLPAGWRVQTEPRTGTVHFAYGSGLSFAAGVATEAQAEDNARSFALARAEALGVTAANLETRTVIHARGKWVVHFQQREQGLPVWHANAFVAMGDNGHVIAAGSDFFPVGQEPIARATLSGEDALAVAAAGLGAAIRTDLPTATELWLVPVPAGEMYALAPAWRAEFQTDEPFGEWATLVHAVTGEILARENRIHSVNVIGNVAANVQDFSYCDGISGDVMRTMTVTVQGGGSVFTDLNGNYVIPHGGVAPVTVTAALLGNHFNVNRYSGLGADASFSGAAVPGAPFQITWTNANARQDEIDVYFHAERAHQFMIDIDPAFDTVNLPHPMIATVGRTDGFCPGNAWYSPSGRNINFCEAGGAYENTGEMGNVIYHEYGHGVSEELYALYGINLPSGDLHEGNSDIIANFIDRTPIIGIGFTNCSGGIRNADNSLQWPGDNDGGHFGGQIIAGFIWDSWQSMLGALPQAEADQAAFDAWHFSRWLGQPMNQQDQVTWTFIADDDDANLDNGTPHHAYFMVGADNHGFAWPPVLTGIFITHQKLGHTDDGAAGFDVVAQITGVGVTLDPSTLLTHYRVNDGSYQSLAMTPTGQPDEYSAHIPGVSNFSEVDYYIVAADTDANEVTDPDGAPGAFHSFDVVHDYDGGETGPGAWTFGVPDDNAVRGHWELVDPVGTLAQPGEDRTPDGTMAWITGQCGPGGASLCTGSCVMPQENGCNDVDFGKTTLISPVWDLGGATAAKVKLDYWYSNDTGASPGFDHWKIDVSNDGGTSWTNVLDTTTSTNAWVPFEFDVFAYVGSPDQVQVRFVAADTGNDSIVEAAIDEFRILADFGGGTDAPVLPTAAFPRTLSLAQNQPNPFGSATRIEFSLPADAPVALTIHDVRGRVVRVLDEGTRAAGRHGVEWDGRDSAGRQVAAGIYFYRLSAGAETLTRKLTVLQ